MKFDQILKYSVCISSYFSNHDKSALMKLDTDGRRFSFMVLFDMDMTIRNLDLNDSSSSLIKHTFKAVI